jgi:energy-coupling factor transporter ATP-binding protein EcfA2
MKKLLLHNISFKFNPQEQPFFHDAHIEFDSGSVYFIQGKNGVGKSTFFSVLQGTTPRSALLTGTIIFDGTEFTIKNNYMDPKISARVKTVVQDSNKMIVNTMTIDENLRLAHLPMHPGLIPLAHTINLPTIMKDFGINNLNKNVQQLSGGQKQILAIMMALQKPTQILLLDEPTAALDEKNTHMVIQFLTNLAKTLDLIIIIITHDKELTATYAQNRTVTIKVNEKGTRTIELL